MKKLKIFLLLSILIGFGFTLSTEVHAQGGGPKIFEIGDVLPATEKLRISWVKSIIFNDDEEYYIRTNNGDMLFFAGDWRAYYYNGSEYVDIYSDVFYEPYTDYDGNHAYADIDTSSWSESERTVSSIFYSHDYFSDLLVWEDLNASSTPSAPKIFEIGDVLPAGYIKISWDFTGKFNDIFDEDVTFWIVGDGDAENNLYIEIEVWDYGEEVRFTINQEEFHIDTPGEIVISIPIPYTIVQIDASEGYDYYDSIGDALLWEVVTEEEFIYYEAYREGYLDGYYLGYEHAREIYGYYDSRTDEWLTVTEYINRYGTDKLGQSDFYNNFDKYFIPALIIVFGGAIVLTILKVFKGRE